MENNFSVELGDDIIKLIDNVVRENFRSRYMVLLYEEKVRETRTLLTEEEVDNYILNCAILSSTADFLVPFYPKLLSIISVDNLNKQGILCLDLLVNVHKRVYGVDTSVEKQQEILKFHHPYKAWDFGKCGIDHIMKNIKCFEYKISNYKKLCDDMLLNLMGINGERKDAQEKLDTMVLAVDYLSVEQQKAIFDKISICYCFGNTTSVTRALVDKEYSKLKYPNDAEWMEKEDDFNSLLAKIGIEMGEMPKTFVDEIYKKNGYSINR